MPRPGGVCPAIGVPKRRSVHGSPASPVRPAARRGDDSWAAGRSDLPRRSSRAIELSNGAEHGSDRAPLRRVRSAVDDTAWRLPDGAPWTDGRRSAAAREFPDRAAATAVLSAEPAAGADVAVRLAAANPGSSRNPADARSSVGSAGRSAGSDGIPLAADSARSARSADAPQHAEDARCSPVAAGSRAVDVEI